ARARVRGAKIDLEAPSEPVRIAIGEARYAQLLDNLRSNVMKYAPAGESIDVTVAAAENLGKVTVTDHGLGIPREHLGRIFDRFYRVGGTADAIAGQGLGLSICKEIVTAHGGHIWAESEGPGRGSTFSFTLPLEVGVLLGVAVLRGTQRSAPRRRSREEGPEARDAHNVYGRGPPALRTERDRCERHEPTVRAADHADAIGRRDAGFGEPRGRRIEVAHRVHSESHVVERHVGAAVAGRAADVRLEHVEPCRDESDREW